MKLPVYSIIIPVYNSAKTVQRITQQILAMSYPYFELIMINDGSTDESRFVLDDLAKRDRRIRVIHQENAGPSLARNAGLNNARGRYIMFFDSDDEVYTCRLSDILRHYADGVRADMVVFAWEVVQKDSKGRVIYRRSMRQREQDIDSEEINEKTMKSLGDDGRMYNLWNKLYDADIIRSWSLRLREDLRFGEDLLFNLAYLNHAARIHFSKLDPYYIYEEDSPTSIVSASKLDYHFRQENLQALEKFNLGDATTQTNDLKNFVKWRWLISYVLSLIGSDKTITEKCRLASDAIDDQDLRPENSSGVISNKRFIMEWIWYITSRFPILFLLLLAIAQRFRHWCRRQEQYVNLPLV